MFRTLILLGLTTLSALAGPRDAQWKLVQDAMKAGLPKTALAGIPPLLQGALKDKAYGEATKAIGLRVALETAIQGNQPEARITLLEAEAARVPEAMKPMLETLLANAYWHYFQENRWRFLQRTRTAEAPGKDFTTWDLPRILAEIDRRFTRALAHEQYLKATPIADYGEVLLKGSVPDAYRPTLFDFIAHEALAFYSAGEQGAAKAEDTFQVEAEGPALGPWETFLKWNPATADKESPTLKALRLYQELLAFHREDRDPSAFADTDLERLAFAYGRASEEGRDAAYKAALKAFAEAWPRHEVSARALAAWASLLQRDRALVEARALADRGYQAFPVSAGGAECFNLIQQIDGKSIQIRTDGVWNDPLPTLDVAYRNLRKVHFRAVALDFGILLKTGRRGLGGHDPRRMRELLKLTPALAWSAELPPTADFQERTERLPAPKGLAPGLYVVFSSPDPAFGEAENLVSWTSFWVSDLAVVLRQRPCDGASEALVLDARSGEPLPGARVTSYTTDATGAYRSVQVSTTDADGLCPLAAAGTLLLAEHQGRRVASDRAWGSGGGFDPEQAGTETVFFTDRSLYRPGQTISYKGIRIKFDQPHSNYQVLAGETLTVAFLDPNGVKLEEHTHVCNAFGAFSGTFTAPRDRGMGAMSLTGPNGNTQIRVEEDKRPKFQVELGAPQEAPRLNGPVTLRGRATAYTGTAIGGAKVQWRVERVALFPAWCWWARPTSQAIAHGSAETASDGSFRITFPARPDPAVAAKDEPVFTFTVHADVTDTTGETRSEARTLRVAYAALRMTLSAKEWQTEGSPVELELQTSTLDGEGQAAEGTLTLHALRQPAKVQRGPLQLEWTRWAPQYPGPDASDPASWETGEVLQTQPFRTDAGGKARLPVPLKAGLYRALLASRDRFGAPVTARLDIRVLDPGAKRHAMPVARVLAAPTWTVEPGGAFRALWATGYDQGRALVELECRGKLLRRYWTAPGATQELIEQPVGEDLRGGFTLRTTFVRENRAYLDSRIVDVPWSSKQLSVKWEHFTSKLGPGQKETWTAVVTAPDAKRAAAEMVAGLYDASLDAIAPHAWAETFGHFRQEVPRVQSLFQNTPQAFQHLFGGWRQGWRGSDWRYRQFEEGALTYWIPSDKSVGIAGGVNFVPAAAPMTQSDELLGAVPVTSRGFTDVFALSPGIDRGGKAEAAPPPDLGKVVARKNLNETAFFFPHLLSDGEGVVRMEFTMPEALTRWKFLGFAHDRELRSGLLTGSTVTAKDLMVEPNPPRFLRERDEVEFTVKVSNPSGEPQSGRVKLGFTDARTGESRDASLDNTRDVEKAFELPAGESRSFAWRIRVPEGCPFLAYRAVGASARLSDGEEGLLPVLSRRVLVTESLPLPMRGPQERRFDFAKLLASGASPTLRHENLVVQMASQPAWYAVLALPYLMEYPYECSEQVFNRFYANALARHIANSDPRIRRVFDLWRGTSALDSPLDKNRDLKQVMVEETPWAAQAKAEGEARRDVGVLFEANRLDAEAAAALGKLAEAQLSDGRWSWFPGGAPSDYITLYVVTGFGRLRHLGADVDPAPATRALEALDGWMDDNYRRLRHREAHVLDPTEALYLYGRSFFLKDRPVAPKHREAVAFFLRRARAAWLKVGDRQSQAHLAVALARFAAFSKAKDPTPGAILRSLRERSVSSEELGMFWRDQESSWSWCHAPIETQAMMIEAFDEVAGDAGAVEACQTWLLKQKQTQDWKTTKATADAVYALLMKGTSKLGSDALVEVSLGGQPLKPEAVEAGTGFYEQRFVRGEIRPELGHVKVRKQDPGIAWGSVHWQYLEDVARVTPHEGTPLKLKKALFLKETTARGQVLKPVAGPLAVGDELVVRLELRVDRDMEYVHLKDQRGSGTEPVDALSRYRFQDGLAYYESTRDTATHFFIEYLPKGTYVFEYSVRVQLKGAYQSGIANIQCMYAPEFNSHSESFGLEVK